MTLRGIGVGLVLLAAASASQAIYNVHIYQVGPDVVMSGSGSVNTSSMTILTTIGNCAAGDGIIGPNSLCIGTETTADQYQGVLIPALSVPIGAAFGGSSSSGPGVYIQGADLYLPENYVSASAITNRSTFAGTTLTGLGLTVGTQTLFVPSGDEIVINIGTAPPVAPSNPASIPTLKEYGLMGLSTLLAMLGVAAARRQQG
ncbi:MAG: IPTL-CTERM sorting domain-containing protein [Gammaproteobacteria bacterium]|nr:IPTL-CTERM sorting domain-containing protein [Gammaproteobacteria bacterium]